MCNTNYHNSGYYMLSHAGMSSIVDHRITRNESFDIVDASGTSNKSDRGAGSFLSINPPYIGDGCASAVFSTTIFYLILTVIYGNISETNRLWSKNLVQYKRV